MGGQDISKQITGGELSGALKFRDTVLDPAQQQLGLVAAGFAVQFNAVHTTAAFDLNGVAGIPMFGWGLCLWSPHLHLAVREVLQRIIIQLILAI